jgi:hypothetical protein
MNSVEVGLNSAIRMPAGERAECKKTKGFAVFTTAYKRLGFQNYEFAWKK